MTFSLGGAAWTFSSTRVTSSSCLSNSNADGDRSCEDEAYHTSNPTKDGTFRKIAVRAKSTGLTARSKTGYSARAADAGAVGPR